MTGFQILLAAHILGGAVALLCGPVPMLSPKGGRLHRKAGQVFVIALGFSCFSASCLALLVGSKLLLTISVLTGFLIATGLRALRFRRGNRPNLGDDACCLLLSGFAVWLFRHSIAPIEVTGLFFAGLSLALAARQWRLLHTARPDWLLAHIAGMGGAYTATVTAFLVVNLRFLPAPVTFIVPTLVGTLLLVQASTRYAMRA